MEAASLPVSVAVPHVIDLVLRQVGGPVVCPSAEQRDDRHFFLLIKRRSDVPYSTRLQL